MPGMGNFGGGMNAAPTNEKGSIGRISKKLMGYSGNLKYPALIASVMAVGAAILTIMGPNQLSTITNYISAGLTTSIDLMAIAKVGIVLATIYLLSALLTYVQHYIMATVTLKLSRDLRDGLSQKINMVPLKYFNTTVHGEILSTMTNDVSTLQQALANSLPSMISASAQFLGCIVMMFVTEWRMASAAICVTILGFGIMALITTRSQKYFLQRQESLGKLNGYVEEIFSGHDVVRISRAEKQVKQSFTDMNKENYVASWKSQFLSGIMQPLMNVIGHIGYVVVCVTGALLVIQGQISFGVIIAFILYVRLFTMPLSTLAQGMTNIQSAVAAGARIFDFLEQEELEQEDQKPLHEGKIRGEVEFSHVHFAYPDRPEKTIIKDFSAKVAPGQKVAIVGPTGAGKTTMVNLLMRFFETTGGDILIDGISIKDRRREEVHSMFGMVLQDTWLFEGTVRQNLIYNRQDVTDEELARACRACGIYRFIQSLPKGFDTTLNENTTISAGQKQLFTIARAMIQNSPMLILDEATSSVDTRTELITQQAMDQLTHQRTSFVIAHRLSTIKNADLILVMRDGNIVEQGTHEQLLLQGGFYSELYQSQFDQAS